MSISLKFPPVSYSYDIEIGNNYFEKIVKAIKKNYSSRKIILLSDSNVQRLYGIKLTTLFTEHGCNATLISFPAGEKSKSAKTKESIESMLIKKGFDRSSLLVVLGGGVVGDVGGYIAATYMRGIPFIQIPTSLLAMVDSSIGGKVAINHPLGKNMVGAFYQPKAVFIDISTLKTLPAKEYTNGLSEIIKSALIFDHNLFRYIEKNKSSIKTCSETEVIKIITGSCKIKACVVMKDEKESGLRKLLNYGHTAGHAIEILSKFSIPHGFCVSIGMNIANMISYKSGLLNFDDYKKINDMLLFFGLPTRIPKNINTKSIIQKIKVDKKSINGIPYFTLIEGIGKGSINHTIDEKLIYECLEEIR